jgi:hypothetical protein
MVKATAPMSVRNDNNQTSKNNKIPKKGISAKTVSTTIRKKERENKPKKDNGEGLDEKGNPYPIKNPEGGDPTCPGGYKIDYDFDPFNDPINPPFRCISALKDMNNGPTRNIMKKLNNPSSNVTNLIVNAPAAGGSSTKRHIHNRHRHYRRSAGRRRYSIGHRRKFTQRRKK